MSGFSRSYCAMMFDALFDHATLSTPVKGDLAWPNYEPPLQEVSFLSDMTLISETIPNECTKKSKKKKKKRTTKAAKEALLEVASPLSQESQSEVSPSTFSQESQFEAIDSPDIRFSSPKGTSPSETVGLGILLNPMGRGGDGYSNSALPVSNKTTQARGAAQFGILEGLGVPPITLPPIVDPSPITRVESPDLINDLNERDPAYVCTLTALRVGRSFTVGADTEAKEEFMGRRRCKSS
jgi:hypothetical protein